MHAWIQVYVRKEVFIWQWNLLFKWYLLNQFKNEQEKPMCKADKGETKWSLWPLVHPQPLLKSNQTKPNPLGHQCSCIFCLISFSTTRRSTGCGIEDHVLIAAHPGLPVHRYCAQYASWRKPSEMALQCYQPQENGSLLVFVRALNHLTFEINSVTSEEDLVTDVTEESDHKTLKTNKQTNLKNRQHICNSRHACPGILRWHRCHERDKP